MLLCLALFSTLLITSPPLVNAADSEKICRALALRGGGTKGSYEVGVLNGFVKHLLPEDYKYDVVVGVSIGAINAAILSLYPPGEEKAAIAELA